MRNFPESILALTRVLSGAAIVIATLLLGGCANWGGQPKALDTLYDTYEQNRLDHYKGLIDTLPASAAAISRSERNGIMNDLIFLIDHNFGRTEKSLYGHKAWADFGGSITATGLSTAGTLAGAAGVKTTLSALVTAIESTKVSFGKDILQGQSILAIVTQMHKLRAEKILEIRKAMQNSLSDYPLSYGLVDLLDYHNRGTFVVALQSMTEDAAAKKKDADTDLAKLKTGRFVEDDAGVALRKYWTPDGKTFNAEHQAKIVEEMEALGLGEIAIELFLDSDKFADQRKTVARKLGLIK
jgi:hypothetical protein